MEAGNARGVIILRPAGKRVKQKSSSGLGQYRGWKSNRDHYFEVPRSWKCERGQEFEAPRCGNGGAGQSVQRPKMPEGS